MGTITWTREARCKDCQFFKHYHIGGRKYHHCIKKNQGRTLKDATCRDGFEMRRSYHTEELILMPKTLTAEDGYKSLLNGEFYETVEIDNPEYCGCGECDFCIDFPDTPETTTQKIPVSWDTIKKIYSTIVTNG